MQHRHIDNRLNAATNTQSKDLWEHAYSNLKKRDPKLVSSFENYLASNHTNYSTSTNSSLGPEIIQSIAESKLTDHEANRLVVRFGNESIKVREKWDSIVKFIFWAKDSISAAASAQPYAALAWAGVSMLLPVSHNCDLEWY